jgi:hypothetical protein
MKKSVWCVALALLLVPSQANAGWWDYFDRLSGPGPFGTRAIYWTEFRLTGVARKDDQDPNRRPKLPLEQALASDDADTLRWLVTLRYVSMSNEDNNNQVRVRLTPADFGLMYRIPQAHGVVDVGAGVTVLTFSGDGFNTFSRVGLLLPKVTLTPLGFVDCGSDRQRAILRSFKVYGDLTWAGHFSAADFNNAVPPFPGDDTVLKRAGVMIDFMTIGYAIFHR